MINLKKSNCTFQICAKVTRIYLNFVLNINLWNFLGLNSISLTTRTSNFLIFRNFSVACVQARSSLQGELPPLHQGLTKHLGSPLANPVDPTLAPWAFYWAYQLNFLAYSLFWTYACWLVNLFNPIVGLSKHHQTDPFMFCTPKAKTYPGLTCGSH